ncbi:P-loop ATPase, Sll1717 family [Streptomyces sp. NPDC002004]
MTEPSAVERLYFGADDAESDMSTGLLRRGFVSTPQYRSALSGHKMLVIGRKGSGKSAICMHLSAGDGHRGDTVLITPDGATSEVIRHFDPVGLTGDTAKSLIWRYVFAVHAARHLVDHAKEAHTGRTPGSVKALREFLKKNGELSKDLSGPGTASQLARAAQGLRTSLSLEAFGIKAGVDLAKQPAEGAQATQQLGVVERGVAAAFEELGCADLHPLLLLVDRLEQVWSAEGDSNSMVIGLLLAAKHATALYGGALRCLLFLRSDIYDSLAFVEADKFHGDELRIEWSETQLKELALARARASAGAELTEERLWQDVFPPTVRGEPTPRYLFERSLPRPRDAIQFLNECRDRAFGHGHERIHESDVVEATKQFSLWKLKDLVNEYLIAHPFLEQLVPLFQNSGYLVIRSSLAHRFEPVAGTLRDQFPAYAYALHLPGILDTLFSVGFLGVRRHSGVEYAGGNRLTIQPHELEFHIHPCFREALGATRAVHLHPYDPTTSLTQIASGNALSLGGGTRPSREYVLLERLRGSCRSILAELGKAPELPQELRVQIQRDMTLVMDTATGAGRGPGAAGDARHVVLSAASYFAGLAAQLYASGVDAVSGAGSMVRRIEDESQRMFRLAGGTTGGSGSGGGTSSGL